jgi:hypothetical protein
VFGHTRAPGCVPVLGRDYFLVVEVYELFMVQYGQSPNLNFVETMTSMSQKQVHHTALTEGQDLLSFFEFVDL